MESKGRRSTNLVSDLRSKLGRFKKYYRRAQVLKEVIDDQKLLREDPPWNLHMIADFHQIYGVAFPPVDKVNVKITDTTSGKQIHVDLTPAKKARKAGIFRDRIRKAIPFFGTVRIDPPILIPQYRQELQVRLSSLLERVVRARLKSHIDYLADDVGRLRTEWPQSIRDLREERGGVFAWKGTDKARLEDVERFSELTVEGFYVLSFAVATGSEIVNHLLTDKTPRLPGGPPMPHIRTLPEGYAVELDQLDIEPWLDALNSIRQKPYSNVVDAQAVALVLKLNEMARETQAKDIFLLLSDSGALSKILSVPTADDENDDEDRFEPPLIKHELFPQDLPAEGMSILRTSYHFEEFLRAYNDDLGKQIDRLKSRADSVTRQITANSANVKDVSRKCIKGDETCPCDLEDNCKQLRDNIGEFLKSEERLTNLESIIAKEQMFESLLKFINRYLKMDQIPDLTDLQEDYTAFFFKTYDRVVLDKFTTTLSQYESVAARNIYSIIDVGTVLADKPPSATRHRLGRTDGIIYEIAFDASAGILNLIRGLLSEDARNPEVARDWYRQILHAIFKPGDDVESSLLTIILLYCFNRYSECEWMGRRWLQSAHAEIVECNKEVEFCYVLASAEARRLYASSDRKAARDGLAQVISRLADLTADDRYPADPRIPHLIGKILAREYLFGIDQSDDLLRSSIGYSQKALALIGSMDDVRRPPFEILRLRLSNNILYCITKLAGPDTDLLKTAEDLYSELAAGCDFSHCRETIACYFNMKSNMTYKEDREESAALMRDALRELVFAIVQGKKENINEQDLQVLSKQLDEWEEEYFRLFEDTSIHDARTGWEAEARATLGVGDSGTGPTRC